MYSIEEIQMNITLDGHSLGCSACGSSGTERCTGVADVKGSTMTIPQADHLLLVWPKSEQISEHQSFVLNTRNTDGHYGGYKLLQNTDLNRNAQARFKQNVDLVICHAFLPSPAV